METSSRKVINRLKKDGWKLDRVKGDHHIFEHPGFNHPIIITHPRKDLPAGLLRDIYRKAGWR